MPRRCDDVDPEFLDPLRVQKLDGPWWELTDRLRYYSAELETTLCVPNGFVTDFASVPRLPIVYTIWGSRADAPAAVHDYLYREAEYPRIDCDYAFLEAMRVKGYRCYSRKPMFAGVRAGGKFSYGQHQGKLDPR